MKRASSTHRVRLYVDPMHGASVQCSLAGTPMAACEAKDDSIIKQKMRLVKQLAGTVINISEIVEKIGARGGSSGMVQRTACFETRTIPEDRIHVESFQIYHSSQFMTLPLRLLLLASRCLCFQSLVNAIFSDSHFFRASSL